MAVVIYLETLYSPLLVIPDNRSPKTNMPQDLLSRQLFQLVEDGRLKASSKV